ncbi:DNA polymerase Y family protein [Variovorax dokdonensis]|uniref:DNA polymerase Y family protein n=1 Tax=Variovorax dokdonensis TaxID=344883 RepID=A0ABT7NDB5_9BURK|nr:DNA polymerase Y family protein [Variovorax dokdonensis]MDM0045945.1 DNA polymerase Y family protein [Variovorax dokdonensis]
MRWIALQWLPEPPSASPDAKAPTASDAADPPPDREALGWWALQFTPRVSWLDEALVLEVSACERLWGGPRGLRRELAARNPVPRMQLLQAGGGTALVALALLRLRAEGATPPRDLPGGLPLETLGAARPHLELLARLGCRTWGDLDALPRGGRVRRFGAVLCEALDAAWGRAPERHVWLHLPEVFDQAIELPALAESAPALMGATQRLLGNLQQWLRARQLGVLAVELQWTLDLRRVDGVDLPRHEQIQVRTAQPVQDMAHLRRLLNERLARGRLAAPANALRLRALDTAPWRAASASFLPEDNRKGDPLHELVERLGARLGPDQVLVPMSQADHRPERMQRWRPAAAPSKPSKPSARSAIDPSAAAAASSQAPGSLYPPWLLREPLALEVREGHPHYQGRLTRLSGPQRVEAGWWEEGQLAVRDYYIAESPGAGLVWIYRERPTAWLASERPPRWYLQGLYA